MVSAVIEAENNGPAPAVARPAQRGHTLFWTSCLVLVPLWMLALFLPIAEVRVLSDPDAHAHVFLVVESPGWAVVLACAGIGAIGYAVKVLKTPVRSAWAVVLVTAIAVVLSVGFAALNAATNAAAWSDGDGGYGTEWFPGDSSGGDQLPFQTSLNRLPSVSPNGGTEPVYGFGIRRNGPWIILSTVAICLLALIGIFCSFAALFRSRGSYWLALIATCVFAVPLGYVWVFAILAGSGGLS